MVGGGQKGVVPVIRCFGNRQRPTRFPGHVAGPTAYMRRLPWNNFLKRGLKILELCDQG